ncbi:MAG: cytochrome c [Pseudomonadota bacterium]|nr:cytochrome c [Pseudomonadota bacterium]
MKNLRDWFLALGASGFLLTTVASEESDQGRWIPALPEQSLAQWYKPQNKRQVWLHTMFALRRELQAVEEYKAAEDRERLAKWAGRLVDHYRKIPEMVPEWVDEVELSAAVDLEQAAATGDFDAVGAALRRLDRTCTGCHRDFRALAAARFRAPDFSSIEVSDGQGAEQGYADHMEGLSRSVNRIKIASEDQRWDAADQALVTLRAGLDALGETCSTCHRDEASRERILGGEAQTSLAQIADGLARKQPKTVGRYLGQAAVQVCARCHGVHRTLSDLTERMSPTGRYPASRGNLPRSKKDPKRKFVAPD